MRLLAAILAVSVVSLLSLSGVVNGHNITHILDGLKDYSTFKNMLVKYGLANQINSRETVTVLCPSNAMLDPLVPQLRDVQTTFALLSYHVLLDYFDLAKLKRISNGSDLVATLYQTTGSMASDGGFLNVTDVKGVPMLGLPAKGSPLIASVTGSIKEFPYTISVLSVTTALVPSGVLEALAPSPLTTPVNITHVIEQSQNFTKFLSLLETYGLDKALQSRNVTPGVTVFAPTDAAFKALPPTDNLTDAQMTDLLRYHIIPSFYPTESIGSLIGTPVSTLATTYTFDVVKKGESAKSPILIDTGHNVVQLGNTLYSRNPVAIYAIPAVLMPADIFGLASPTARYASPPAPAPTPITAQIDSSSASTPSSVDLPGFAPPSTLHASFSSLFALLIAALIV